MKKILTLFIPLSSCSVQPTDEQRMSDGMAKYMHQLDSINRATKKQLDLYEHQDTFNRDTAVDLRRYSQPRKVQQTIDSSKYAKAIK